MLAGAADLAVFIGYLVAVIALGFWVGRGRRASSEDYFLAGRSIPWYAVGTSFIGSNISTEHFIGMIGAAYVWGICIANWEWANIWTFSLLIWIFIPFLLSTRVFSAPEFLERRFNSTCRLLFAILTVIASVVAFLAAVLYAGAKGIDAIFSITPWLMQHFSMNVGAASATATVVGVLFIGLATGCYAIFGGLNSVVWTDVFQVVVMFLGGILVTVLGLGALGHGNLIDGWHTMLAANRGHSVPGDPAGFNRLSLLQPMNHKLIPWAATLVGWVSVGVWYSCINQFMIQRVLAARNIWHARMGIVFAGFMKIFLPMIVVIPGLIMFAMDPHMADGVDKSPADRTFPIMVNTLVPAGLKGLILATLFGAIQSTISAVLNSTSTVLTLDIYERFMRPTRHPARPAAASTGAVVEPLIDRHTVRVGLWVSTVVLIFSMILAPLIELLQKGVFVYIQDLYAHFAPPFSALFVVGLLWRRANARAAVVTIVAGLSLSILIGAVPEAWVPGLVWLKPITVRPFAVWLVSVVLMIVVSLCSAPPSPEKVTDQTTINWKKLNIFTELGPRWYTNVIFWYALFALGIATCYVAFSGLWLAR